MAESRRGDISVTITADHVAFGADMTRIRNAVANAAAGMQRSLLGVQQRANTAAAAMLGLRSAFGLLTGGALLAFVQRSVEAGDRIAKTAQKLGMGAEAYQELAYAAKLAGVEQEDFSAAMTQFTRRLGEVNAKGTEGEKTLGKLGLSMEDIRGKTPDEALKIVADRLMAIQDPMQRNAVLMELFGRSGVQMAVMLQGGSAELAAMAQEARRLGFVIDNETLKKTEAASDELDRISQALRAAGISISAGILPALESIRKTVTSQDFQDGVRKLADEFGRLVKWLVEHKDTIVTVATALAGMKLGGALGRTVGTPMLGAAIGAGAGLAAGVVMTQSEIEKTERELEGLERRAETLRTVLAPKGMGVKPLDADMFGVQDQLIATQFKIEETKKKLAELKAKAQEQQQEPATPDRSALKIDVALTEEIDRTNKLIDDLTFKTRLARGEFAAFAEGFPEAAHALGVFGTAMRPAVTSIAELPAHLQRLNAAMENLRDAEKVRDIAKGIGDAFGRAFEDAIVEAKSLQEVLQALYKDLLRLLIRKMITEPLSNALTNFLPALIPGRAEGGPVMPGELYWVGERGRELFVPDTAGTIVPERDLHEAGPPGGAVINIDARGADPAAIVRLEQVVSRLGRVVARQGRAMASAQHFQATGVVRP